MSDTVDTTTIPKDADRPSAPFPIYRPLVKLPPSPNQLTAKPDSDVATPSIVVGNAGNDLIQVVADANAAVYPQSNHGFYLLNSIGSGLAQAWGSVLGKIAIIGALAGLVLALFSHFSGSSSSKKIVVEPQISEARATQLQSQVDRQLATASKALQEVGYSESAIREQKNLVQLQYNTAIRMAAPRENRPSKAGTPLYIVGSANPSTYVPLTQINVQAYAATLSKNPTIEDARRNSAVAHGMETGN